MLRQNSMRFLRINNRRMYCFFATGRKRRLRRSSYGRLISVPSLFRGTTGTAAENMDALDQSLADNKKAQEAAAAAIVQDAKSRDVLRMYLDQLRAEAEKDASAERLLTDGTILFLRAGHRLRACER